jgi:hypothetical protein
MKERDNYGTMRKVVHLYTKKICSCLGLLIVSIHKHVVLSVLNHEHHEHYAWQGPLGPRFCRWFAELGDSRHQGPVRLVS